MGTFVILGPNKVAVHSALVSAGYANHIFHLEERVDQASWLFIVSAALQVQPFQMLADGVFLGEPVETTMTIPRAVREELIRFARNGFEASHPDMRLSSTRQLVLD
ncbi:hypothetical protein KX729_30330 [Rhizobium sp. XQZ8]|uniref:hypothetical protein n=1 Tax=Rhizobium populisoli TaxID=2859785 RepID=UPI001CA49C72|nr:hypothetical protein [Rhizobium populisoli]MBW6425691.1 hypothetical protein [Rhizobium populisoli]